MENQQRTRQTDEDQQAIESLDPRRGGSKAPGASAHRRSRLHVMLLCIGLPGYAATWFAIHKQLIQSYGSIGEAHGGSLALLWSFILLLSLGLAPPLLVRVPCRKCGERLVIDQSIRSASVMLLMFTLLSLLSVATL